jgi:hypothetical protein
MPLAHERRFGESAAQVTFGEPIGAGTAGQGRLAIYWAGRQASTTQ